MNYSDGFSGIFDLKKLNFEDPILLSSTDGVGTKLKIAIDSLFYKHIGIDLVAMCVNDILVNGGKPIFFLDYFSTSRLNEQQLTSIIKSINDGCKIADCPLIGGETAEMPGMYKNNDFDIAGFAVGIVERDELIKKERIKNTCCLLGIESNGFHSNGFSLIRDVIKQNRINLTSTTPYSSSEKKIYQDLLLPTKIYTNEILPLVKQKLILSMAHITGGGIIDNLLRIIPDNYTAVLDFKDYKIPERFLWLSNLGKIHKTEMLKTFNCGIGFVIAIDEDNRDYIIKYFNKLNLACYEIGKMYKKIAKKKIIVEKLNPWF